MVLKYGAARQEVIANWPFISSHIERGHTIRETYSALLSEAKITATYSAFFKQTKKKLASIEQETTAPSQATSLASKSPKSSKGLSEQTPLTAPSSGLSPKAPSSEKPSNLPDQLHGRQVIGGKDDFKPKTEKGRILLWEEENEAAADSPETSAPAERSLPTTEQ